MIKSKEEASLSRATLALAVAGASALIALASLIANIYFTTTERTENILVSARPGAGPVRVTSNKLGSTGHVVQVPWEVTISNSGLVDTAILGYDLLASDAESGIVDYSGLDGGLVQSSAAQAFPMTLSAGESVALLIYMGLIAPPEVADILVSMDEPELPWETVRLELARHGMDLLGDSVELTEFSTGDYVISERASRDSATPRAELTITTSRGGIYSTVACIEDPRGFC